MFAPGNTLEQQFATLGDLVKWDPNVVAPRGCFSLRKVARYLDVPEHEAEFIINNLRTHLDKYVDDNDFCNKIKWCFEKGRISEYSPSVDLC
jgi:hypothetical protein